MKRRNFLGLMTGGVASVGLGWTLSDNKKDNYSRKKDCWIQHPCTAYPIFDLEDGDCHCLGNGMFCSKFMEDGAWYNDDRTLCLVEFKKNRKIQSVKRAKK